MNNDFYDTCVLKTAEECRIIMKRASEQQRPDVYTLVFHRYCELVGGANDDPADPLVADFHKTLAAYEQILTEKNNRNTRASRTRQKIQNKGVLQSLVDWTRGKTETNGFKLLIQNGLPEYTGEYLVVRYSNRFPDDVVMLARSRLEGHGITPPVR